MEFLDRLKQGLSKTRQSFTGALENLLLKEKKIDEAFLTELEEMLITADLGVRTTNRLIDKVRERVNRKELLKGCLKEEILNILAKQEKPLVISSNRPFVVMVIGVNGVGKTTVIAKLAQRFKKEGKKVLLAALDTFRAAAIEQLEEWGKRVGCEVIKQKRGADPSAVAFDAIHAAQARGVDLLLADTAGRLHTKTNLMEELKKIKRIMGRELPGAPHETLLVLDATIGQNAISQAELFQGAIGVSGICLTKLDGTSKGGIIVAVSEMLGIPLRYIGIGEKMDDLRDLKATEFVDALFPKESLKRPYI